MLSELANLEDLRNLLDRKFSISLIGAYLVVNDVWYLDSQGNLQQGHLAAKLIQTTPETIGAPENHQMYWSGMPPYYADGTRIPQLGNSSELIAASVEIGDVTYLWHLSNKPPEGFSTYSALVEHYVALISGPAEQKFGVSSRTGATYDVPVDQSPFKLRDTFSARAEITDLNRLFAQERVAVIGLGGTGAYVLDFLVKTPVASIHAYDFDLFEVHTAFRSPGAVARSEFGHRKVEVYRGRYEPFRHNLTVENRRIGAGDGALFAGTTFAFICIDDGEARGEIVNLLLGLGIPFIDVGMGVEKEAGKLDGIIRTTYVTAETSGAAVDGIPRSPRNDDAGAYRTYVQIAELNALNAALAVIRYKQAKGFYADERNCFESLITLCASSWGRKP